MFYIIHIYPDRILVTNRVEDYVEIVIKYPPKGRLINVLPTFTQAYFYAREIADRYGWILEWYFGWVVLMYFRNGKVDRVLITSRLEHIEECYKLGLEKCKEYSYHLSFLDAYMVGRSIADLWDAVLEWFIQDEVHTLLETTMRRPVTI